jgi:CelD/BcsL family acetyltransferase involved in cellulose biosynthesis
MIGEPQAIVRLSAEPRIRIDAVPTLESVRDEWAELAEQGGNIFSSWEWASIWWRHYGGERPLLISACRTDDGRLAAVLPLYLWSERPLRIARFLGHGPADELGPVCAPEDRAFAAAALRRSSVDARLDLLLAQHLPGGQGWREALGATLLEAEASPTLALGRGWDAYLASRSANFRQQIRGRERRLAHRHSVRFRLATDVARLEDDLTVLFSLHSARWGEGSPFTASEEFHREFARVALQRGWLRLWLLVLDGRPAAAWYGFRFGGVESYYQAGRDPRFADASVGFVLLAHSIREAATDGMREYRFLRGAEPFKLRFADADPGVETLALSRGVAGRLAAIAAVTQLRRRSLRSTLRRLTRRARA